MTSSALAVVAVCVQMAGDSAAHTPSLFASFVNIPTASIALFDSMHGFIHELYNTHVWATCETLPCCASGLDHSLPC